MPVPWRSASARALGLACLLAFAAITAPAAQAARIGLREAETGLTTIQLDAGQSLVLELFIDTEGETLEGYVLGADIDVLGGSVSALSVTHQNLTGLFPDFFGPAIIDNTADTIRNTGQGAFSASLPAGVYVVDLIDITVDFYGAVEEITVTPGLFGEVLGVAGGSCPGTAVGCAVTVESATIIPEPQTALLMGVGLAGLAISGRKKRTGGGRLQRQLMLTHTLASAV